MTVKLRPIERITRFKNTTWAFSWQGQSANSHPDRCVCQELETGRHAGTPHTHYSTAPYACARCACKAYEPALLQSSSTTRGKAALGVSPVAPTFAGEGSEEPALSWRVGRKLGRTLYREDLCVGMVDTPELAADIVKRMNESQGD